MIKTPVKRTDGCLHMKHWHIRDADGMVKLTCSSKEDADQIVAALNAQQPECEKCEGSGTQKYTVDVYGDDNLPMSRPCPKCRPKAQREVKPKSKQEGD